MFQCRTAANSPHTCSWPATGDSLPRAANIRQQNYSCSILLQISSQASLSTNPCRAQEDAANGGGKTAHMSSSDFAGWRLIPAVIRPTAVT